MSDYLGRLAERAVGRPPRAKPRLKGPFAEPDSPSTDAGLESVEAELNAALLEPRAVGRTQPARREAAHPSARPGTKRSAAVPEPADEALSRSQQT